MSDVIPQLDETPEQPAESQPAPRRKARIVGLFLVIAAAVLAWLLLVGFLGYQSGQTLLVEQQQSELINQIDRQLELAAENLNQGSYDLALVRLEWVLTRQPQNGQARNLQEQVQLALNVTATPTPEPFVATATPRSTLEPSATPGAISNRDEELQRLRRLNVSKVWSELVPALIAFQLQFPDFERAETDELLYEAYLGYSSELLEEGRVETGLFYIDQAETLGDLPQSALDYRSWAELYAQGISFYGANWEAAAFYFRDLCLAAPFFQDACSRLFTVLVSHGDQYAALEDWCPAVLLYEEAWRQSATAELADQLDLARAGCLSATPTLEGPITGTVPLTNSVPLTGGAFTIPTTTPDDIIPRYA